MADKESVMTRVMKLLNLAADENASPAERQLAAERAERLMEQHMIDRLDLKPEEKSKIAVEDWEINVGDLGNKSNWEYFHSVVELMDTVLRHTGCRLNYSYDYKKFVDDHEVTRNNYELRVFHVVGFPEDLAFADRIWFRVYKEFVGNINPTWVPGPTNLGKSCYNFLKAGYKWADIWRMAYKYQQEQRKTAPHWAYVTPKGAAREVPDPYASKYAPMLKAAVKEYCASIGETYQAHTQRHEAYRSSFARSFSSELGNRLDKLRREAAVARNGEAGVDGKMFALALRTTKEQVDEEFYRLYPQYDPEVRKRKQEERDLKSWFEAVEKWNSMTPEEQKQYVAEEAKQRAREEAKWLRDSQRARRNYGALRNDPNRVDMSAWERGRDAARKVDLTNNQEVAKPATKALG